MFLDESNSYLATIIGSAAAVVGLIVVVIIAIIIRRCHQSRLKDVEYESKLTANSRLSSDDASTDGVWDDSYKHSNFSTYKCVTYLSRSFDIICMA